MAGGGAPYWFLRQLVLQGQQAQAEAQHALQAQRRPRGDRAGGGGGSERRLGIDARQSPRPDACNGDDKKWQDWSI
eukprot:3313377-Pyramimonas_sp.AAC.1